MVKSNLNTDIAVLQEQMKTALSWIEKIGGNLDKHIEKEDANQDKIMNMIESGFKEIRENYAKKDELTPIVETQKEHGKKIDDMMKKIIQASAIASTVLFIVSQLIQLYMSFKK